ncbi:hypothetical protein ACS0TY_006078 [Phlomoides rotata]
MVSLLRICHLLMASLFALSASFQFNDPDWYLWIPLYSTACVANLVNGAKGMGKFALWLGLLLFIKVAVEDLINGAAAAGFWSLDMRERVVREKFGSGLVVTSMFLVSSSDPNHHPTRLTKYDVSGVSCRWLGKKKEIGHRGCEFNFISCSRRTEMVPDINTISSKICTPCVLY